MAFFSDQTSETKRSLQQVCLEETSPLPTFYQNLELLPKEISPLFIEGNFLNEEFLLSLEKSIGQNASFMAIATQPLSLSQWLQIKKQWPLCFLFETPIYPFEIRGFLKRFGSSSSLLPLDESIENLNHLYETVIPKKLERLECLYTNELSENDLQNELQILAKTAHAHHYFMVAQLALIGDQMISRFLQNSKKEEFAPYLSLIAKKIRSAFQLPGVGTDLAVEIQDTLFKKSLQKVYLIDMDHNLKQSWSFWLKRCGIDPTFLDSPVIKNLDFKLT